MTNKITNLEVITHLAHLDTYHRVKSWQDAQGQHYTQFCNGPATTDPLPVSRAEVNALETTLEASGWQVTPSLSMRGNFRAVPMVDVLDADEGLLGIQDERIPFDGALPDSDQVWERDERDAYGLGAEYW